MVPPAGALQSSRGGAPRVRRGARRAASLRRSRGALPSAAKARARRVGGRSRCLCTRSRRARLGRRGRAGATPHFASYYLGGGLLTAALLGAGSLLLVGRRWAARVALVYAGLAIGVAIAAPLQTELSGTEIPEAQDVLDLWPARILAILGQLAGDARGRRRRDRDVPLASARQRPDPGGHRGRGDRERARRARRRRASSGRRPRRRPPLRRVRGPVVAHGATPTRARRRPRARPTPRRSRRGSPPCETSHA